MGFRKMTAMPYPPRLWTLVGFPGSGKSTFAAAMRSPMLVIDADQRFREVLSLAGEVYALSDTPADNTNPERIAALLAENMPGSEVGTIVIDSLTAIVAPLITRAMIDNDAGRHQNRMAAFKDKALCMRVLQDAVSKWGTDCLWIYHLQEGRDAQAKTQTTATVSKTELARLLRSINLQLELVQNGNRRGVKVTWARRGRSGMTLWDTATEAGGGCWAGMPEKIEAAVYDGLSQAEQDAIENDAPTAFPNPETAISWGYERGAFATLQYSRDAYEKLKQEKQPKTAAEMRDLWVAEVQERLSEMMKERESK